MVSLFFATIVLVGAVLLTGIWVGHTCIECLNETQENHDNMMNEIFGDDIPSNNSNDEPEEDQDKYETEDEFFDRIMKSEAGDPPVLQHNGTITITNLEPEHYLEYDYEGSYWHDKLMYIDLDCDGKKEWGDRSLIGNLIYFVDNYPKNGKLDCGFEMGWSLENTFYENFRKYDSNKDGVLDKNDPIWESLLMTDFIYVYPPERLGYDSFIVGTETDPMGWVRLQDDWCHEFVGTYTDGEEGFVKDWKYDYCLEQGWRPIEPITTDHIRAMAYNDKGAHNVEFGDIRIYSAVLGFWYCENGNSVESECAEP